MENVKMENVNNNLIMNALTIAMKEFDVGLILEFTLDEIKTWSNELEILNTLTYEETKYYMSLIEPEIMKSY